MKKLLLIIPATILLIEATAQPVITNPANVPQPGDAYIYIVADTAGISEGMSGANVTWDLGELTDDTIIYDYQVLHASATPYFNDFQSADFAIETIGYDIFSYYDLSASGYEYLGYRSPSFTLIYSDPLTCMNYPFTYGATLTDESHYSYESAGYTFTTHGSMEMLCDGYGTLIMPCGVFPNTLRIKQITTYTSYNTIQGSDTTTSTTTSYFWYAEDSRISKANISYTDYGTGISKGVSYSDYTTDIWHGRLLSSPLIVYPNPASDWMTVILPHSNCRNAIVKITDILGNEILNIVPDSDYMQVDLRVLNSGIYFVVYESAAVREVTRFVRE